MASLAKIHYGLSGVSHNASNTVTEITGLTLNSNGTEVTHAADTDTWLDFIGVVGASVDWSVETGDLVGANAVKVGDEGTLAATIAGKGASSALTVSLLNAVVTSIDINTQSQDKSTATISGKAFSVSGSATPLTIS